MGSALHAVRAHLLSTADRHAEAAQEYRTAAQRTLSTPERHYLLRHAAHAEEQTRKQSR